MKNVQFISELPLILLENKIVGFDQDYLDQMYAKYDELEDIEDIFDLDNYRERKVYLKKTNIRHGGCQFMYFNLC